MLDNRYKALVLNQYLPVVCSPLFVTTPENAPGASLTAFDLWGVPRWPPCHSKPVAGLLEAFLRTWRGERGSGLCRTPKTRVGGCSP